MATYGTVTPLRAPIIWTQPDDDMPFFAFVLDPSVHPDLGDAYADNDPAVDAAWTIDEGGRHADLVLNFRSPKEFVVRVRCSVDEHRLTLGLIRALPADPTVVFYPTKEDVGTAIKALSEGDVKAFLRIGVGVGIVGRAPLSALGL
jgi:hypothetical protein